MYATLHVKLHQLHDNEILILNGYIPMIQTLLAHHIRHPKSIGIILPSSCMDG